MNVSLKAPQSLILGLSICLLPACQVGPGWVSPIEFPAPSEDVSGKRVIVSNFLSAHSTVSVTGSARITSILESARVHDVSLQIASALREEGIDAEARVQFSPRQLRSGQVLLSGAVTATPWKSTLHIAANLFIFPLSLMILGGILPSPVPYRTGGRVAYRAELVAADGRILMQTGDQNTYGYYDDYWFWGGTVTAEEGPSLIVNAAQKEVAKALAIKLRSGAGSTVSSAPKPVSSTSAIGAAPEDRDQEEHDISQGTSLMLEANMAMMNKDHDKALALSNEGFGLVMKWIPEDSPILSMFYVQRARILVVTTIDAPKDVRAPALAEARDLQIRGYRMLREDSPDDSMTKEAGEYLTAVWGEKAMREALSGGR